VFLRELVRDGQTETATPGKLGARRSEPVERPENSFHFLGRNAGPAIAYFDDDLFVIAVQADVYEPSHAVLRRVLQQICQYALEGGGIGEVDARRILAVKYYLGTIEFQVGCERFDHLPEVQLHGRFSLNAL